MGGIRAGDNILWEHGKGIAVLLGNMLALFDRSWRKRVRSGCWPWHAGIVINVLDSGEIVTLQAVAKGVQVVTYESREEMGDCRIWHWLRDVDQEKLEREALRHLRWGYDYIGYLFDAAGNFSMYVFRWPWRIVDRSNFCWETMSELDRKEDRELQPAEEPCNIARMVNALEADGEEVKQGEDS